MPYFTGDGRNEIGYEHLFSSNLFPGTIPTTLFIPPTSMGFPWWPDRVIDFTVD